jgi:hypothetical protein
VIKINLTLTGYNNVQISLTQLNAALRDHYIRFKDYGFWVHPKFKYEEFRWRSDYLRQCYMVLNRKMDSRSNGQVLETLGFLKMSLDCSLRRVEEFKSEWECYDTTGAIKDSEKLSRGVYIGMVRESYPDEDVSI